MSGDDFLSRWSRRKLAAKAPPPAPAHPPAAGAIPAVAGSSSAAEKQPAQVEAPAPLPPVESLTPESDFTPFMRSEVDPSLRQQALRTLFRDPRFNEMDGLDVYISDFSKPDPIPADWLGKLNQLARLGDYRPPEEESKPAEGAPQDGAPREIVAQDQQLEGPAEAPESHTSDVGSQPPELKPS